MHEWYGVRVGSFKVKTFLAKEREHLGVINRVTLIEHNHFPKRKKNMLNQSITKQAMNSGNCNKMRDLGCS